MQAFATCGHQLRRTLQIPCTCFRGCERRETRCTPRCVLLLMEFYRVYATCEPLKQNVDPLPTQHMTTLRIQVSALAWPSFPKPATSTVTVFCHHVLLMAHVLLVKAPYKQCACHGVLQSLAVVGRLSHASSHCGMTFCVLSLLAIACQNSEPLAIYIRYNTPVNHPVRGRLEKNFGGSTGV